MNPHILRQPQPSRLNRFIISIVALQMTMVVFAVSDLSADVVAVPLPDPKIPNFSFPEPESRIVGWVNVMDTSPDPTKAKAAFDAVHLHGWGIWTALTQETDQVSEGQKVRVFESWYTPGDLPPGKRDIRALRTTPRKRTLLEPLHQLQRGRPALLNRFHAVTGPPITRVAGFVKYDPSAAEHIVAQGLLENTSLTQLFQAGADAIPPFPASAIALKPVFQVISQDQLKGGRYYQLPVWPGPPAAPQAWGPDKWPSSVWIDVQGGGKGKGKTDDSPKADGSSRTDDTTYPVSSLINVKLSAEDAANWNQTNQGGNAQAGDFAILVAMHVTSKEITRWTWQTFWWTPTPDDPHPPSLGEIAALRPAQLQGPQRNYAMSLAYSMVSPPQPYVGGSNTGNSVYAYNPWLEAGFDPSILIDSKPGMLNGVPVSNNYGIQTNCMSCHAQANYNPGKIPNAPDYTGDQYIDLNSSQFLHTLKVDFLWSLPDNAK